ncbi:ROK family protein [Streptomyces albidochromogenes]|uniref:ROK family protein n=1 Tax=Streptomyces albidochromogenes TaxID=329524 RepID=UPI00110F7877|nr:ROK family protein [Streptomyces albidochromogenes]
MSYLGIDVGGTKVALRLEPAGAEGAGEKRETVFRWPDAGGVDADMEVLAAAVAALRPAGAGPVAAVGVAVPATLDTEGRVRGWPNRPFWQGLDLRRRLTALLPGAEVRTADDGDLAALAEADAAHCRDLVHFGVGTGIGGGIVLDGRICPGTARGSCEVGHLIVDRAGERCDCGRRGCVQSVASGRAVLRRAGERLGRTVDFAELRTAWLAAEPWAVGTVNDSAEALAAAAVGLTELVHPRLVTVGGGFAAGLPGYVEAVARHAGELARAAGPETRVRPAALGGLSSLDGAVLLARGEPR